MRFTTLRTLLLALVALVAVGAVTAQGQVRDNRQIPNCTPRNNIEAIFDDSGSMAGNDPQTLRRKALDLFIDQPDNARKILGAVEFGSSATPIFAPGLIGSNAAAMKAALLANLTSDAGATNYNDAFALAASQNPNATGRIFLTDGGHNVGTYANGHQTPSIPTYVIGFGGFTPGSEDFNRLQQIANETGGVFFPQTDASNLQSVMVDVASALDCRLAPTRKVLQFQSTGQTQRQSEVISASTRKVVINATWPNQTDKFDIVGTIKLVSRGRVIKQVRVRPGTPTIANASARRKRRRIGKLRVEKKLGQNATSLTIRDVKRGTLRYAVRAVNVTAPTPVTVQVNQSTVR